VAGALELLPMKWLKRLFRIVACVAVVLAVGAGVAWYLARCKPSWYPGPEVAADPAAQQAAAVRAENELKRTIDWAASQQAEERARLHTAREAPGAAPAVTRPATTQARRALTVTLTEQELNASFAKWGQTYGWGEKFGQYITDPRVVLHEGRIIVAGTVEKMGTLVSLHFEPKVDQRGRLQFELARVLGGRLPLPESAFDGYREKIEQRLRAQLPALQRGARIAPDGSANDKAVGATMAKLLIRILNRQPDEAVLFLPANQGTQVPVKLTGVDIHGKSVALTVELMTPDERAALLDRIRAPQETASVAPDREADPPTGS
jgi:hypothetical protein